MTTQRRELIVHWWAALGLVTLALVSALHNQIPDAPPRSLFDAIVITFIALNVGGFNLYVLIEILLSRGLRHRWGWLALFFLLPAYSPYLYFWVTRSALYRAGVSKTDSAVPRPRPDG